MLCIEGDRKIETKIWWNFEEWSLFLRSFFEIIAVLTLMVTSLTPNWVKKCPNLFFMYQWRVAQWGSGYRYCITSINLAWTQVLHRFKSCLRRVEDSRRWGSLTMVPAGIKAKRLSLVNHTTKTIHHHHHHHQWW